MIGWARRITFAGAVVRMGIGGKSYPGIPRGGYARGNGDVNTSQTRYSGEFAPWPNTVPGWNAGNLGANVIVYANPREIQTHLDAIG